MRTFAVLAVSCWSGFLVMALELLSGRILAPTFGSSIYVWGAVITVFMVALSVGYLIGGRISLLSPSLARLAALHLLSGLLLLPIMVAAIPVLDSIFTITEDPRMGALLASMVLFFLPAMVCGCVSPVAIKLLIKDVQKAGFYAGLQYFFSTFFSAAGTLLTSFYFVLIFEVNEILWLLFGVTAAMAAFAFTISKTAAPAPEAA
ncbi:MAG: fused MFS/spermidine synthase [Rhodospirillaceae bacterium]|nr:fused MFS/spermidine synthase [Rhodospirillaceae bacterium]